jgi:uncharacterized protein (DUF433 family)
VCEGIFSTRRHENTIQGEEIMDWTACEMVEVAPGRLNGRPVVKDTRVAADTIWESAELGRTPEEISSDYRLKLTDVRALLAYAASHSDHAPAR